MRGKVYVKCISDIQYYMCSCLTYRKWEFHYLGPCTHLDRTVLTMLQDKMPNFSWTSCFLKWSAGTDYSTNELYTIEIKTSWFYYLFIFCANKWTTFCTLGPKHMRERRTHSASKVPCFIEVIHKSDNCCSMTLNDTKNVIGQEFCQLQVQLYCFPVHLSLGQRSQAYKTSIFEIFRLALWVFL